MALIGMRGGEHYDKKCEKQGDKVRKGDLICRISGESEDKVNNAKEMIVKGIKISNNKTEKKSKILEIIT